VEVPGAPEKVIVEKNGKPIGEIPVVPGKKEESVVATDPHRRAAEMVLKYGGTLFVRTAAEEKNVARREDLPNEPFIIYVVRLANREVPDDAMEAFDGVHYVAELFLNGTKLTDRGFRHLRDLRCHTLAPNNTKISDESLKLLAEWQDLTGLDLEGSPITDVGLAHLKKLSSIRFMRLANTEITDAGVKHLANHRSLRNIEFGNGVTAEGLSNLRLLPSLRGVGLRHPSHGDETVEALSSIKRLAFIDLRDSSVTDEAARRLQRELPKAVVVHPATAPTDAEREALRWALENKTRVIGSVVGKGWQEFHAVPELPFYEIQLTMSDAGPRTGAAKLRGLRSVSSLSWRRLKHADAEAEHIASLDGLRNLEILDTNLTATGVKRLTALDQLEALNLGGNSTLTDDALAPLRDFKHLSSLWLTGCPVTDAGLEHISRVGGLQQLALDHGSMLTGAGLKHLAALPVLRRLILLGTPLDERAVESLKLLSSVRVLEVQETKLAAAGIAELHKALPKCAIVWDGGLIVPGAVGPK
jgi:hypothetical protein